jgi:D-inositol-3-phosphate glycosyltransferase
LKISLIGPIYPYRGGIAHYTYKLATSLSTNHRVQLISFQKLYPAFLYPGKSIKDTSDRHLSFPAEFILNPLNPLTWIKTARAIKKSLGDLLIIQWWVTFMAPAYTVIANFIRRANIPVLILIHNVLPHEERFYDRFFSKIVFYQGDLFMVHSPLEKLRLLKIKTGVQVQVCDFPIFDLIDEEKPPIGISRARLGLPGDKPIILFFGIVRPYKGLEILLKSLQILNKKGKPFFLIIAGEFWSSIKKYRMLVEEYHLADLVKINNYYIKNEEIKYYFSAADLLVAPYLSGTQSASVSLGLSYDLPIVLTEPILTGVEPDRRNRVIVVPAGDPQSLAEAIDRCFANLPLLEPPDRVRSDGWRNLSEEIERLYRHIRPPFAGSEID